MSFIQELFEFIKDVGEFWPDPFEGKYQYARRIKRMTYYGSLRRLEEKKLIRKIYNARRSQFGYAVTIKGKKYNFSKSKLSEFAFKNRNDGLLTVVVFDVPEHLRKQRSKVRLLLKKLGFKSIQQSVFIGTVVIKDVKKKLTEERLIKYVKIISGCVED